MTCRESEHEVSQSECRGGIDETAVLLETHAKLIRWGETFEPMISWPRKNREDRKRDKTRRRLLVVDDNPDFGELVRSVGVKLGFEVQVANGGEAFMRLYDSFEPSVVMLDIVMPGIEGIELIQWLGARRSDAHVIVVTGYSHRYGEMGKMLAEAKGLRNVATLNKPFKLSDLRDALTRTTEE